mgnify:CR=1 FL=1
MEPKVLIDPNEKVGVGPAVPAVTEAHVVPASRASTCWEEAEAEPPWRIITEPMVVASVAAPVTPAIVAVVSVLPSAGLTHRSTTSSVVVAELNVYFTAIK